MSFYIFLRVGYFGRDYHEERRNPPWSNTVHIPEPLHKIPSNGVVIGWRTYFSSVQPTKFQIWRHVSDEHYMLIGQTTYIPSKDREVHFDVPPSDRFFVRAGDVIGILFMSSGTVAYSIKSTGCTLAHRTRRLFGSASITIGTKKKFGVATNCREYSITVIIAGK